MNLHTIVINQKVIFQMRVDSQFKALQEAGREYPHGFVVNHYVDSPSHQEFTPEIAVSYEEAGYRKHVHLPEKVSG